MSDFHFKSAADVLTWLRENRNEPFAFVWCGNRLFCGFRNDEGEIDAFEAAVLEHRGDLTRRKRTTGKGLAVRRAGRSGRTRP